VWRTKLCGDIGREARWQLVLDGSEAGLFSALLELGSGASVTVEGGPSEVAALWQMADRYQVEAVQPTLELAVVRLLTVESCGRVLELSSGSGAGRLERASREMALGAFDEFAATAGFMEVGEEALGSLLDDDELVTEKEERVLEAVVRWMQGGDGGGVRGLGLLGKVRLPWMEAGYLADLSRGSRPELAGLAGLVAEALTVKSEPRHMWGARELACLDRRALAARSGFEWKEYFGGGERRLDAGHLVTKLAVGEEYVCGGLGDGRIRVWRRSTLELERTLTGDHEGDAVTAVYLLGDG
jgi:hypothetical protein